jgi:hypothetical protein
MYRVLGIKRGCHPRIFSGAIAEEKISGIQLISSYKIIRKLLFIDTHWIPDKFLLRLLADTKFSGMTRESRLSTLTVIHSPKLLTMFFCGIVKVS